MGQGGEWEGGLAIPLTTIKLRREHMFVVVVCLSFCPKLHPVGRGEGEELLVNHTGQKEVSSMAP